MALSLREFFFLYGVVPRLLSKFTFISSCVLGFFREGVFQKMPALEGQFLKEISVRFAGENHLRTLRKTHKTKLCAEVPERPLPKDAFFQQQFTDFRVGIITL